jgi:hypothetical protein
VVSNGAKQAIWQALLATCAEGDEVGSMHAEDDEGRALQFTRCIRQLGSLSGSQGHKIILMLQNTRCCTMQSYNFSAE